MALAFEIIRFDVEISPSSQTVVKQKNVHFPSKIRLDENGNRVIDVALKSFTLEAYWNGQPEDYEIGGQEVSLKVEPNGHESGEVTLSLNLRPRRSVVNNPHYQFKGHVEALVIADLDEGHK